MAKVNEPSASSAAPAAPTAAAIRTVVASSAGRGEVRRASLWLLWVICAFFVVMFIWIAVAEVDTVTRATGRVIPSAKLQVVQNLEGGIVTEILAKQGQKVEAGVRLVSLSTVQHDSERQTRVQQLLGLEARAARLAGLAAGTPPVFSQRVNASAPGLAEVEMAAYQSKLAEHRSLVAALEAQLDQRQRELQEVQITLTNTVKALELGREERATVAKLVERGLEPRLELVRIDRNLVELEARAQAAPVTLERVRGAITEINSRIDAIKGQFRAEALAELNRTQADLNALQQSVPALADRVARAEIKSPMKGVVNRVFVNTVGGVVKPGDPIVEIVPADDQLVVEALVLPKDIGFTKLGQKANVKITAYDYSIFGSMDGTVVNISADAVPNEKGEAFYLVKIETETPVITAIDKKLPIMPGMQAQVDIITGKKTILQFLSKPLVGLKENAFRER